MVNFQPDDFGEDTGKKNEEKPLDAQEEEIQVNLFPEFPHQRLRRMLRPRNLLFALLTVTALLSLYGFFVVQGLSSDYYIKAGDRFMTAGDYASAASHYQQAVQFDPQNPEPYERLGWSEYQQAQDVDALKHFENALSLSADRPLSLYGAGLAAYRLHSYEESISYLTQLIQIAPTHAEAYEYLGLAEYRLGQYETAGEHLNRAYIYNPQNATVVYYLSRIHSIRGEADLAIQSFNEAEKLGFDAASIAYARGLAYMQAGEYESALADLQKASSLYPARKEAALSLAKAFYLLKDYAAAQSQLADIQVDIPAEFQSQYLEVSGWAALRQGYTDAARDSFNRWLILQPNHVHALNALGWAAYYAGDCQTASFYFESAVQVSSEEWISMGDSLSSPEETPQVGLAAQCPLP
jgi:tetratricopeptide (TPR) repeat protein